MHRRFGADIDAFSRFVKDNHLGMGRQPFADHHFLLIAAGKGFHRLPPAKGLNLQARGVLVRQPPFAGVVKHAAGVQFAELRQADVLGDRQGDNCSLLLPLFRHADDTGADRVGRLAKAHRFSLQHDIAGRGMRDPGERLHQLGAPGAHQPVKAKDLPFAQAEADMGELGGVAEVFHLQHRFPWDTIDFRVGLGNRAAHHHRHHPLFGDVVDRTGADVHAVAQNGVVVRQLENLIELMRDKQDRFAVLLQALNDLIELQNFMLRERGGRLIEDYHLSFKGERPGDGDHMALGDTEGFQRRARVNLYLEAGENFAGFAVHGGPVELLQQAAMQILADEDIFGDREFVEQHGFLMNRGDPNFMRRLRVRQLDRDRFIENLALFGLINAGHHFDQRRFPRAVFAD